MLVKMKINVNVKDFKHVINFQITLINKLMKNTIIVINQGIKLTIR